MGMNQQPYQIAAACDTRREHEIKTQSYMRKISFLLLWCCFAVAMTGCNKDENAVKETGVSYCSALLDGDMDKIESLYPRNAKKKEFKPFPRESFERMTRNSPIKSCKVSDSGITSCNSVEFGKSIAKYSSMPDKCAYMRIEIEWGDMPFRGTFHVLKFNDTWYMSDMVAHQYLNKEKE